MTPPKTCRMCGTDDPGLYYRSGKMHNCYDCQNYHNLTTKKTGGGVEFTHAEFIAWKRAAPDRRRCTYCGLDGAALYSLDIANPRTGRRLETIGVDRIDNALPYRLDNIEPCCAVCNQVKSQLFTSSEMRVLGPHLRLVLDARIARATLGGRA